MTERSFAFLVHPREVEDFLIKFSYLRILPEPALLQLTKRFGPVRASRITGLTDTTGEPVTGYVVGMTMTAHQMVEDPQAALSQIRRAVVYARDRLNAGIIGLGALTASFSRGGLDLADISGIGVTTGRAYTVKTILDHLEGIRRRLEIPQEVLRVAVIGAAGSIGSSVAAKLAQRGYTDFLLIDLERKLKKVETHMERMCAECAGVTVATSHHVGDIVSADVVIAATNAPEVVIQPDDLKPGAIVINDAQPSDISPRVITERPDVLVIEGGIVHSDTIRANFNFRLASRGDLFSCLAETLVLAHHHKFENFAVGELDLSLVETITTLSAPLDLKPAVPQNSRGIISNEQVERIKTIVHSR